MNDGEPSMLMMEDGKVSDYIYKFAIAKVMNQPLESIENMKYLDYRMYALICFNFLKYEMKLNKQSKLF